MFKKQLIMNTCTNRGQVCSVGCVKIRCGTQDKLRLIPGITTCSARAGRGSIRVSCIPLGSLGEFTYDFWRYEIGVDPIIVKTTQASLFQDNLVVGGTTYYYYVVAINQWGVGRKGPTVEETA